MSLLIRTALAASIVVISFTAASAQTPLTKQDRQGPVTVAVTLMAPPEAGTPLKVKVVFDTHSVALDSVAFAEAVALRSADGAEVAPIAAEAAAGGGHHRSAVVVFAPVPEDEPVRIVVKNVGGITERVFTWDLPAAR